MPRIPSTTAALLAIFALFSTCAPAHARDTELTTYFKKLPPREAQLVRTILTIQETYMTTVDYSSLGPGIIGALARTHYGAIYDMHPEDPKGLTARADPANPKIAQFFLADPQCPARLDHMKASLSKLGVVADPSSQVACDDKGFVVRTNPMH